ncbi:unnamed protein product, partial [marine sediment metagenome]
MGHDPQYSGLDLDRVRQGHNYYFFNFWLLPKVTSTEMGPVPIYSPFCKLTLIFSYDNNYYNP